MLPNAIPERTLGFAILDWCSSNLVIPDGERQGEPWVFQPDQALFILHYYSVDDHGRWLYRRAYRERSKGSGKSPMVAAIACAELLGPVVFSHFSDSGSPVGKPHPNPLIQIAAGAESQTMQTMTLIGDMLAHGPASKNYNLDIAISRIVVRNQRRKVEMVTSNFRSREGARPSFVILEETHGWLPADRGPDFARVLRRNLAKGNGRSIEVTNAPVPGEGSVAEETHKFQSQIGAGIAKAKGLLFDSFSIHVDDIYDRDQAIAGLQRVYANAPWVDLETIYEEILDPSNREVDSRRFFFNEIVKPEAMWLTAQSWGDCLSSTKLKNTDLIAVGFKTIKQCCAITATRLSDNALFLLEFWEKPHGADRAWEVPWTQVDGTMRHIFETYNVCYVAASPEGFQEIVGRWAADYTGSITVEELWTSRSRQKTCDAIELFSTAVNSQRLSHDGNLDLTRHIMNCFTEKVGQGTLIRPETEYSSRYITAATAAVLSTYGAQEAIADGLDKEPPSGYLYSF